MDFRTLHQRVADELGRRIVGGAWGPGDPLPVEDVLAAEIGVSRGVLREAVKSLVAKGMLRVRPRTGTRVLAPEHWNHLDRDVLRWKQAGDATALLRDTGELRRIIEPEAARLAAGRAGPTTCAPCTRPWPPWRPRRRRRAAAAMSRPTSPSTGHCSTPAATASSAHWAAPSRSRWSTASSSAPGPRARWRPRCRGTAPSCGPSRPAIPRRPRAVLAIIESAEEEIARSPGTPDDAG